MADTYTAVVPLKWVWTDQPTTALIHVVAVRDDGHHLSSVGYVVVP